MLQQYWRIPRIGFRGHQRAGMLYGRPEAGGIRSSSKGFCLRLLHELERGLMAIARERGLMPLMIKVFVMRYPSSFDRDKLRPNSSALPYAWDEAGDTGPSNRLVSSSLVWVRPGQM